MIINGKSTNIIVVDGNTSALRAEVLQLDLNCLFLSLKAFDKLMLSIPPISRIQSVELSSKGIDNVVVYDNYISHAITENIPDHSKSKSYTKEELEKRNNKPETWWEMHP